MFYKDLELTITEPELYEFIQIEREKILYSIHSFSDLYNGALVKNPTQDPNALYYVLTYGDKTYLQPHVPFVGGYVPILEANALDVIDKHIEQMIDVEVFSRFAVPK